jgi:hypothetical protein
MPCTIIRENREALGQAVKINEPNHALGGRTKRYAQLKSTVLEHTSLHHSVFFLYPPLSDLKIQGF